MVITSYTLTMQIIQPGWQHSDWLAALPRSSWVLGFNTTSARSLYVLPTFSSV